MCDLVARVWDERGSHRCAKDAIEAMECAQTTTDTSREAPRKHEREGPPSGALLGMHRARIRAGSHPSTYNTLHTPTHNVRVRVSRPHQGHDT